MIELRQAVVPLRILSSAVYGMVTRGRQYDIAKIKLKIFARWMKISGSLAFIKNVIMIAFGLWKCRRAVCVMKCPIFIFHLNLRGKMWYHL